MKRYKLLKDLPIGKAGDVVFECGSTICFEKDGVICSTGLLADMLCQNSWFEEIEESADKPKEGYIYFYISDYGDVCSDTWSDTAAIATLMRDSSFEPDWSNNDQNKWTAYYDHNDKELLIKATAFLQYPSAIYFDTYDSIKKSIKNHKKEWLIYFGIEEENNVSK